MARVPSVLHDVIQELTFSQPYPTPFASDCNYCNRPNNLGRVTFGQHTHRLDVLSYEALLDSGYLRSGSQVYIPLNDMSCCPNLPIRLDATRFMPTSAHKKSLARVQQFLSGARPITLPEEDTDVFNRAMALTREGRAEEAAATICRQRAGKHVDAAALGFHFPAGPSAVDSDNEEEGEHEVEGLSAGHSAAAAAAVPPAPHANIESLQVRTKVLHVAAPVEAVARHHGLHRRRHSAGGAGGAATETAASSAADSAQSVPGHADLLFALQQLELATLVRMAIACTIHAPLHHWLASHSVADDVLKRIVVETPSTKATAAAADAVCNAAFLVASSMSTEGRSGIAGPELGQEPSPKRAKHSTHGEESAGTKHSKSSKGKSTIAASEAAVRASLATSIAAALAGLAVPLQLSSSISARIVASAAPSGHINLRLDTGHATDLAGEALHRALAAFISAHAAAALDLAPGPPSDSARGGACADSSAAAAAVDDSTTVTALISRIPHELNCVNARSAVERKALRLHYKKQQEALEAAGAAALAAETHCPPVDAAEKAASAIERELQALEDATSSLAPSAASAARSAESAVGGAGNEADDEDLARRIRHSVEALQEMVARDIDARGRSLRARAEAARDAELSHSSGAASSSSAQTARPPLLPFGRGPHKLTVILKRPSYSKDKHELYVRFNTALHRGTPDGNTERRFTRHLLAGPTLRTPAWRLGALLACIVDADVRAEIEQLRDEAVAAAVAADSSVSEEHTSCEDVLRYLATELGEPGLQPDPTSVPMLQALCTRSPTAAWMCMAIATILHPSVHAWRTGEEGDTGTQEGAAADLPDRLGAVLDGTDLAAAHLPYPVLPGDALPALPQACMSLLIAICDPTGAYSVQLPRVPESVMVMALYSSALKMMRQAQKLVKLKHDAAAAAAVAASASLVASAPAAAAQLPDRRTLLVALARSMGLDELVEHPDMLEAVLGSNIPRTDEESPTGSAAADTAALVEALGLFPTHGSSSSSSSGAAVSAAVAAAAAASIPAGWASNSAFQSEWRNWLHQHGSHAASVHAAAERQLTEVAVMLLQPDAWMCMLVENVRVGATEAGLVDDSGSPVGSGAAAQGWEDVDAAAAASVADDMREPTDTEYARAAFLDSYFKRAPSAAEEAAPEPAAAAAAAADGDDDRISISGWDLSMGYGSFVHEYALDGQLIACSVLDVLPTRVASIYFFYDPDFRYLQLGKLSALVEVWLTRQIRAHCAAHPAATTLLPPTVPTPMRWWDANFYVHSCTAMNYKRQFQPTAICSPALGRGSWVPLSPSLIAAFDADPVGTNAIAERLLERMGLAALFPAWGSEGAEGAEAQAVTPGMLVEWLRAAKADDSTQAEEGSLTQLLRLSDGVLCALSELSSASVKMCSSGIAHHRLYMGTDLADRQVLDPNGIASLQQRRDRAAARKEAAEKELAERRALSAAATVADASATGGGGAPK